MQTAQSPALGSPVRTPVSQALAQLLHQVQEQIALEAQDARNRAALVPVLSEMPPGCQVRYASIGGAPAIEIRSPDYFDSSVGEPQYTLTLYRDHFVEEQHRGRSHPAYWRGSESRRDQFGQSWERRLGRLVTDDFGYLVQVPSAVAQ